MFRRAIISKQLLFDIYRIQGGLLLLSVSLFSRVIDILMLVTGLFL